MQSFVLYHATDKTLADSIIKNGFKCKPNANHWLGNGIYFYPDCDLAKWWATNPTSRFGKPINTKCILKATVQLDDSRILDLRKVEDYKDCVHAFHTYSKRASLHLDPSVKHEMEKYRCSFFDWLFSVTDVDCIIGCFTNENKAYLTTMPSIDMDQLRSFCLPFVETQFCIREGYIAPDTIEKEWEE